MLEGKDIYLKFRTIKQCFVSRNILYTEHIFSLRKCRLLKMFNLLKN